MIPDSKTKRKTILTFADYYVPSYKAGGPVRSIENLVLNLSDKYKFLIVTRNRDLGDSTPFLNVKTNEWTKVGDAEVLYLSRGWKSVVTILKVLREVECDIIYFNSFFSRWFTIYPLFLIYFKLAKPRKTILAPRGEFSPGALKIKAFKKTQFIKLIRQLHLLENTILHATSESEVDHIKNTKLTRESNIFNAPNQLTRIDYNQNDLKRNQRDKGPLKIIFLSRITPKKNLVFLLEVLSASKIQAELSIVGPIEDLNYWRQCLNRLALLPSSINVKIAKPLQHGQVFDELSKHDLFVLPTLGENFGHIIYESLVVGTPVLISDQTPWRSNGSIGLQEVPLKVNQWIQILERWAKMSQEDLFDSRIQAIRYAQANFLHDQFKAKAIILFESKACVGKNSIQNLR